MPRGILVGQVGVVFGVTLCGIWAATQWTAATLGYQARLGASWFGVSGIPVYHPWCLFDWWYLYDAYASAVFLRGGAIAASSGLLAAGAATTMAVWRSRLAKRARPVDPLAGPTMKRLRRRVSRDLPLLRRCSPFVICEILANQDSTRGIVVRCQWPGNTPAFSKAPASAS